MHFHLRHDVRYKGKKIEKTLNSSLYICYIGDKKMKVVQVGQTKYYIEGKDDMISIVHELAQKGYSIEEIAKIFGISRRKVIQYLGDCW